MKRKCLCAHALSKVVALNALAEHASLVVKAICNHGCAFNIILSLTELFFIRDLLNEKFNEAAGRVKFLI